MLPNRHTTFGVDIARAATELDSPWSG
ncbi:unnamed protein product [Cuscuta epithymum]|uniref:Uncharacterized protein n=1 Tax=Cuscuta epithymum TaxID=186058 RepID=A0AAV0DBK3_9ASTE|nr:unnamed protein product [Cuscuta epithymum]CAH9097669.1 unnamed protein product [Cuscuta epithymum]